MLRLSPYIVKELVFPTKHPEAYGGGRVASSADCEASSLCVLVLGGEWGSEYRYHYGGIYGYYSDYCWDPLLHSPLSTSKYG